MVSASTYSASLLVSRGEFSRNVFLFQICVSLIVSALLIVALARYCVFVCVRSPPTSYLSALDILSLFSAKRFQA